MGLGNLANIKEEIVVYGHPRSGALTVSHDNVGGSIYTY